MHICLNRVQKDAQDRKGKQILLLQALNRERTLTKRRKQNDGLYWHPPDGNKLARIVLRLQKLVNAPPQGEYHPAIDEPDPSPGGHNARRLYRLLAEFTAFPYIQADLRGSWTLRWMGSGGTLEANQMPALVAALELAQRGEIDRVRRCANDRNWFLARTADSRFCSTKCRERYHQRNPEYMAKRREYARNLYQLHKNKNIK